MEDGSYDKGAAPIFPTPLANREIGVSETGHHKKG